MAPADCNRISLRAVIAGAIRHPAAVCGMLLLLLAGPAAGQHVVGTVVDGSTGEPIAGAFVVLLDSADSRVAYVLTDHTGRFILRAAAPGTYRLQAERIGLRQVQSAPMKLGAETMTYRFELHSMAIRLDQLEVQADTRDCRVRPADGTRLQLAWDQVRTALETTEWANRTGYVRGEQVTHERLIDPVTGRVTEERVQERRTHQRAGFVAAAAEELVTRGFVQRLDEGEEVSWIFYGLDAGTLTSDAFLDRHCFQLQRPPRGQTGLIGLAFEPVRSHRAPSVRGVLWVDEATAELRSLEYGYTWLPYTLPDELFGGDTHFRRLPGGAWIVERWAIRMPRLLRPPPDFSRYRIPVRDVTRRLRDQAGLLIKEEGGEVTAVFDAAGTRLPGPDRAAVAGIVFDSIAGRPLAGARVWLEGTDREVTTDARGRYSLEDLSDGVYGVRITHAVLNALGVESLAREVELVRGDVASGNIHVPSLATLLSRGCAAGAPATAGAGAGDDARATVPVVGRVFDAMSGRPVRGAALSLSTAAGAPPLATTSGPGGVFRFCDVPAASDAVLAASFMGGARAEVRLSLAGSGAVAHEFRLQLDAPSRVTGRVIDFDEGRPVGGATVLLDGAKAAVTSADGRFHFPGVQPGDHVIALRHLAFQPVQDTLRIDGTGRAFNLEIKLPREPIRLDAITVTVAERPLTGMLAPVHDRLERVRLYGGGHVFDRSDIERRNPRLLSHLLSDVPGIRVAYTTQEDIHHYIITSTRSYSGTDLCVMTIYMDGMMLVRGGAAGGGENVDHYFSMSAIEAIEVYQPGQRIPSQYWGSSSGCGVILVWTRRSD
jgi:hypothetical protein